MMVSRWRPRVVMGLLASSRGYGPAYRCRVLRRRETEVGRAKIIQSCIVSYHQPHYYPRLLSSITLSSAVRILSQSQAVTRRGNEVSGYIT